MASKQFKKYEKKCDLQEKFLGSLKKKIDNETGVDVCLWQLSYSYMRFVILYKNKQLINQTKILEYIKEQMESQTFQELENLKFKKKITIKHFDSENELHYIWEHKRDKTHPHGKVNIFCSGGVNIFW